MSPLPSSQQISETHADEPTQAWMRPDDILADEPLSSAPRYADIPVIDGPLPEPEPFPAPAADPAGPAADLEELVSPANEFLGDWRDLPLFRATARVAGWCGIAARKAWRSQPEPPAAGQPAEVPAPARGAYMRGVDMDGKVVDQIPLPGVPQFIGAGPADDGVVYAGVALSFGPDGGIFTDSADPAWWDALIAAATAARDNLPGGAR